MAYVWASYKGHHRLRHPLPEAHVVLRLLGLALLTTLVLHVLPLLRDVWTATILVVFFPLWGSMLRSLFRRNRRNAEYFAVFLVYFFVFLDVVAEHTIV